MPYTLILGSRNYSSWSMRAWLLLKLAGAAFEERLVPIYAPGARDAVRAAGGETGLAPVLIDDDVVIWETLAIGERLAEAHDAIWPRDGRARARARSLSAEMHSGFQAIRRAMPLNLRGRRRVFPASAEIANEMGRIGQIFEASEGAWLCGEYSAADIMFAPMAARFRTYDVTLSDRARRYAERLLSHPDVETWVRDAGADTTRLDMFELPEAYAPRASGGDAGAACATPLSFDHVGIRVTDRRRAVDFYESLGFHIDATCSGERVAEIVTATGVRLNLLFNGATRADGKNVLLDLEEKWAGYTHAAFVVKNLDSVLRWADRNGVPVTEGPVDWGRRIACFLRDPDGNVLEFNELVGGVSAT